MYRNLLVLFLLPFVLVSCIDQPTSERMENIPPTTYLWLMPDDTLRTTTSRQHIHWWGDDPDGFVVRYEWSFDAANWTWTERNDSVFTFSMQQPDTVYNFYVRAVDNIGERDPDPAHLRIPVKNSPPSVEFIEGSDVPDTTFPVATFVWSGTDPDGDDTIEHYYWALNDISEWNEISGGSSSITLYEEDGLRINETNVFYLKAIDNAGAYSSTAIMPGNPAPDNPDRAGDSEAFWYVREAVGDILFINDYGGTEGNLALSLYRSVLDTLEGGRFLENSQLNIRRGRTGQQRGELVPALINPTLIETFRLFDVVVWFTDDSPSAGIAQSSLPGYMDSGGKVLYSGTFPSRLFDAREMGLLEFAPVDSVGGAIGHISSNTLINTTPAARDAGYPQLYRDDRGVLIIGARELIPESGSTSLYHLDMDDDYNPLIGVKNAGNTIVFMGFPMHRANGSSDNPETQKLGQFFRQVLIDDFGL